MVGGGWRLVAVGGWWRLAVGGGWRRLAGGGGWRLVAIGGGWRLAARDPWGLSLTKKGDLRDSPGCGGVGWGSKARVSGRWVWVWAWSCIWLGYEGYEHGGGFGFHTPPSPAPPRGGVPSRLREYAGRYFQVHVRVRLWEEGVLHLWMGGGGCCPPVGYGAGSSRSSRREGTSEAAPAAGRRAVGGGCQSGWGRLLSVTNAIEAGTWRQGDSGWA